MIARTPFFAAEAAPSLDLFAAGLDDPRPFPTEAALAQLGQALTNEALDLLLPGA